MHLFRKGQRGAGLKVGAKANNNKQALNFGRSEAGLSQDYSETSDLVTETACAPPPLNFAYGNALWETASQ